MIKSSKMIRYRLLISILIGIGCAIYAFTLKWNSLIGNTPEELEQAEKQIERSFVNDKGEAIEPDWSIIQDIADKLIYENSIIIKARALLKYKSNPNVHKSNPGVDNKSSTAKIDWSKFERRGEAEWSKYIVDDINDDVEWNDRNVISKHNLLVISKTSRINKSAVVAVLSGIGSTLLFLLIMFLISILWYFMLNRLSELSRAIQWRFSMTKFLNPTVYFILGIISVAISFYLSLQRGTGYVPNNFAGLSGPQGIGAGVDIAADGGAAGFAILSGICFFCSAYLIKNKQ